jgi:alkylation response protein AidB-like acyl-CoA dehydrogenase
MDFRLSDEQNTLQQVADAFFARCAATTDARAALDAGRSCAELTATLAEADFVGLLCPESLGGGGATVLDVVVVAHEAGRHLVADPIVNAVGRAAVLLRHAATASAEAADLLARLIKGNLQVTVLDVGEASLIDGTVTATSHPAQHAQSATTFLVSARNQDGEFAIGVVERGHGVESADRLPMDPTRGLATVRLEGAPVAVIATGDDARRAWGKALDVALVLLAAQSLGTTGQARRLGVEYALQRKAFGRVIGGYQAIKHKLVDVYVLEEQLRSLVWLAAWSLDTNSAEASLHARAAAAYAADAVVVAAKALVHVHGGTGFTWEHDAHLFWRRAMTDRLLLGSADEHRDTLVTYLLEGISRVP